ncbi:U3 small nucleolar RNA-associated protein 25 [Cytospora mali]|uniref:U3 small nucleolar RNA-associated protein 25 n=1 Tax=Cytospora mali TaxID=578113 RepID=A0A194V6M9_CYTMA|nr:U3 small nucleolar RNA-associated protein 25 [Valsa mali var. pyri (nom. inval.)]
MGPRGRSGFRGGGGSSRGRGPKFDSARLEYSDSEEESGDEGSEVDDQDDEELGDASEDEDEEESKAATRPYMALIQSLTEEPNAPQAKRRKLDHQTPQTEQSKDEPVDEAKDVDLVEEPEEAPDENEGGAFDGNDDEDEVIDTSDPFEGHFGAADEETVTRRLKAIEDSKWTTKKVASKGTRTVLNAPDTGNGSDQIHVPNPVASASELRLKHRLQESMKEKRKFDAVEQSLAPHLFGYRDLLYCDRKLSNSKSVRRLACLHALNHVFKTRDRVIKNNSKLSHQNKEDEELELRDQGFTRPKVLMILPTRESCYKMIETMASICEPETQENRKRLEDSYHDKEDRFPQDKPADFKDVFAGNDDDMFRLGVKFTRKTIKYFAAFYNSDILFASPLGLRMAIGSEEDKKVEHDFLSSIEVVIVDQADALLMQNWEHIEYIFEHLNLQPKDDHGCDYSRVRNWYLEDQSKYFRQTVVFSQFNTPELSKLFRLHCRNWAGKVRIEPEHTGVIQEIGVKAKQTFSRFDAPSVEAEPEARFNYFTKAIVPSLAKRSKDSVGTLIFIPSYLDFVRVRNYFATNTAVESLTFGTISEYASIPEASRARSHFFAGRHKVLLYTERAHHFRRYILKGVVRVIMYGLPDNPTFYKEIVGGNLARAEQDLEIDIGQGSVRVMFSKYDVLRLERIVGTQRVGKMIREKGDTFDFV